jgi:hypothetical protein
VRRLRRITQDNEALVAKVQDMERAQAAFHKKEIAKREGQVALSEYHGALKAERDKTEKLRALRLAKEAADAEAAQLKDAEAARKPAPKPAAKAKKKRS